MPASVDITLILPVMKKDGQSQSSKRGLLSKFLENLGNMADIRLPRIWRHLLPDQLVQHKVGIISLSTYRKISRWSDTWPRGMLVPFYHSTSLAQLAVMLISAMGMLFYFVDEMYTEKALLLHENVPFSPNLIDESFNFQKSSIVNLIISPGWLLTPLSLASYPCFED